MEHKVFVYGTLKRNHVRDLSQIDEVEFLGDAKTIDSNFLMLDQGQYPAVIMSKKNGKKIKGEVFKVSDDVLDQLDAIEGYPWFYNRKMVDTTLGKAIIYFMDDPEQVETSMSIDSMTKSFHPGERVIVIENCYFWNGV